MLGRRLSAQLSSTRAHRSVARVLLATPSQAHMPVRRRV
jgi:hypothetical protein